MSEEHADRPSGRRTVAILPWTVALLLFLVLAGAVALVALGMSGRPLIAPDTAVEADPDAASDSAPDSEPDSGPVTAAPPEAPQPEILAPAPASAPETASEPDPEPATETVAPPPEPPHGETMTEPEPESAPEPAPAEDPAPPEPVTEADPAAAPDTANTPAEPAPEPEPQVAAAPPPPPETAPPVRPRTPGALPPAPDPALVEPSPQGPLPKIDSQGREPWQVYARPYNRTDEQPKVAVILSGLGLSSAATDAAIQGLPGEVTLAFQPFADNIQQWIRLSRAAGHEVLLNLPMEPVDFPANDPGPRALFVSLSPEENQDRLRWALSRVSGYVGVVNHMGSRFTVSREAMQPILAELKARGLLFVDARSAARSVATVMASEMQVPRAVNDRFLDNREVSRATVDARLAEVEDIARETGVSIAIGQAFPVTIERIREWSDSLAGKGISLVPISAVVDRQPDR